MKKRFLATVFISMVLLQTQAQTTRKIGFQFGVHASSQSYSNILNIDYYFSDTIRTFGAGNLGRRGLFLMIFKEFELTKKVSIQTGFGYRERGFISDRYVDRERVEAIGQSFFGKNRFHNIFFDLRIKYRWGVQRKVIKYVGLANRLDMMLVAKSDFWREYIGAKSGRFGAFRNGPFTRFELSPVFFGGFEIPLNKPFMLKKHEKQSLLLEFEFNPGIMNVIEGEFGNGLSINGSPQRPFYGSKIVTNSSFGVSVGIKF
jgi:hypothetical protein